jgi:GPI ethanolamine phosphate transferase 1
MVAIGLAYLAFQKNILENSRSKIDSTAPAQNGLSRALIGAQVGICFDEWKQLLTNRRSV